MRKYTKNVTFTQAYVFDLNDPLYMQYEHPSNEVPSAHLLKLYLSHKIFQNLFNYKTTM